MSNVTPNNERLVAALSPDPQAYYVRLSDATEKLAAKRPEFAPVYREYRQLWLEHAIASDRHVNKVRKDVEAHGVTPQYSSLEKLRAHDRDKFARDIEVKMKKHGKIGDAAGAALDKTMNKSWFSDLTSNIYDDEKGVRWGGLIGGLLGGLLLSNLSGGTGTWFGIFAVIIGAVAGSWLGSVGTDYVGNKINDGKAPPAPAPGQAKTPELDPDAKQREENAKRAVREGMQPAAREEDEPSHANPLSPTSMPANVKKPAKGTGKSG